MDERLQLPIYFSELGEDAQTDLLQILQEDYNFPLSELRETLLMAEAYGDLIGHLVIYDRDIPKWYKERYKKTLKNP